MSAPHAWPERGGVWIRLDHYRLGLRAPTVFAPACAFDGVALADWGFVPLLEVSGRRPATPRLRAEVTARQLRVRLRGATPASTAPCVAGDWADIASPGWLDSLRASGRLLVVLDPTLSEVDAPGLHELFCSATLIAAAVAAPSRPAL